MSEVPASDPLTAILGEARRSGFLGPGPVVDHVRHAQVFVAAVDGEPRRALDLGSGGGVPGLILARLWPHSTWVLLDAGDRRTRFLIHAVAALGLGGRTEVVRARAEEAGRFERLRGGFGLVVARSFGSPSVTAECAAPFLEVGGRLVVSEPPVRRRWPEVPLAQLGFVPGDGVERSSGKAQILVQDRICPDRFPRRVGVAAKRPLF